MIGMRGRYVIKQVIIYALLLGLSAVFMLPFLWMVATSLKKSQDVFTYPPSFLPNSFEWRNYIVGWNTLPFTTFLKNSLIVTIANVLGNLISCSLVAFGFALLVSRSLQSEIGRFLAGARRLAGGDFSTPVQTEGDDEFAALGAEFNTMAGQLESRLEDLRRERGDRKSVV